MVAFSSGVPAIKSGGILQVHVLNDEGHVPELPDIFNPPQTAAMIRHIQ